MSKNRRLLLKAVEHNWDESGPGDWVRSEWHIFDDGSYEIVLSQTIRLYKERKTSEK